ncbi:MAG: TetR/AcrR family transcriptional regulator [Bacteroidota bacterium]
MHKTKEKILNVSLRLFNESGFPNVRLQHLADGAGISVGNLAYHYPNKESILQALHAQLTQEQRALMAEFRIVPLFEYWERQMQRSFDLFCAYAFFYQDTLELIRAYPAIQEAHQKQVQWQIKQNRMSLAFNVSRGALEKEAAAGQYESLAVHVWMTSESWLLRQQILGKKPDQYFPFREALWQLIRPFFTEIGRKEFEQLNRLLQEEGVV